MKKHLAAFFIFLNINAHTEAQPYIFLPLSNDFAIYDLQNRKTLLRLNYLKNLKSGVNLFLSENGSILYYNRSFDDSRLCFKNLKTGETGLEPKSIEKPYLPRIVADADGLFYFAGNQLAPLKGQNAKTIALFALPDNQFLVLAQEQSPNNPWLNGLFWGLFNYQTQHFEALPQLQSPPASSGGSACPPAEVQLLRQYEGPLN